ncbi:NTP transferase domain-containing protein [Helicobacter saguini]|uniref:NTP transferase domain-containing protein n=1 Tax=Helicobacter saguini TaxID=1548018 RepID=A0A347VP75_9HELI|nr:phosphocholine cytidylyltransferase family protein [Helicobacter saguini]MWV61481.1 NTP transferase domain-containing protein [Helicobacter saguini]MWV67848.1 NTP transferase domain-containing protein [Helicobacter saguini]MWV70684.1 NTP transferase domain-containing protein [Helicobacter saguini]MWV72588.1 NTP transferase domain-containing protein [Helicobacter saguini]TLD94599.1 phosphocholine cytidylyltransferase family protein [Helicobacter saguini]
MKDSNTNAIILAAGFGSRLMPLTANVPKCMVEYKGRKIIDYELEALKNAEIIESKLQDCLKDSKKDSIESNSNKIKNIAVIGGYKADILQDYLKNKINRFYINSNFANTNMVATLFCGREFLRECVENKSDLIVSYADIIYTHDIVEKLLESSGELNIIVDDSWLKLWEKRFDNPLSDAETLKIRDGKIKELGKKARDFSEIESQYIGLFKIRADFLAEVIRFYDSLDKGAIYDGKDFQNMYMTSFLQAIIDKYDNARAVRINGGWLEIDNASDLAL